MGTRVARFEERVYDGKREIMILVRRRVKKRVIQKIMEDTKKRMHIGKYCKM